MRNSRSLMLVFCSLYRPFAQFNRACKPLNLLGKTMVEENAILDSILASETFVKNNLRSIYIT